MSRLHSNVEIINKGNDVSHLTADAVIVKDDEALRLIIKEGVRDGIREYHAELNITPDHWAHLRREYEKSRANGMIVRRTVLAAVLTAAMIFGYNALTDHLARAVSHHYDQRERPRDGQMSGAEQRKEQGEKP